MKELLAHADDETRALWDGLVLGYTETLGLPLLRQEIAAIYETIEADDVIAVVGASEALFILMSALVRPDDHVVALWPAYQSLYDLARSQGAEVELVPLRPEDGWALDLDRIAAAMRPNTRAVIVNLPHNPTGMHVSEAEFDELVELVDRHGATLVCDEVYRGLEHDPATRLPAAADRSPRAVSVGVLSKSYALAGLRVGWLATRDRDLLAAASQVRDYTSLCSPAPSEVLGVIALRAAEALLERSCGIIAANLAILDELFASHPERIEWVRPTAGSIGFPRYLGDEGIDAFNERLVREQGVLLLPGRVYDYGGGHFRLGFGRTNLPEAVERLDRQLRA
jgi:aspartate/methionine/tyrosine aminotransferase